MPREVPLSAGPRHFSGNDVAFHSHEAADRAGHEVTEAAVQAWYQAAIEAGAVATRPLGEQLSFTVDIESNEDGLAITVKVPIYRSARLAAAHAAREAARAGVATICVEINELGY